MAAQLRIDRFAFSSQLISTVRQTSKACSHYLCKDHIFIWPLSCMFLSWTPCTRPAVFGPHHESFPKPPQTVHSLCVVKVLLGNLQCKMSITVDVGLLSGKTATCGRYHHSCAL